MPPAPHPRRPPADPRARPLSDGERPLPRGSDLEKLIARAAGARPALLPPHTDVYRLVHDEADGLPGLAIDAVAPVAMVQAWSERWRPQLPSVVKAVLATGMKSVRAVVRAGAGLSEGAELRAGDALPDEHTAVENGLAFRVRTGDASLAYGIFPDARLARERVRRLARGQEVLNLFAYAGGFTVAALAGGAHGVDQVDSAPKVASWAARNVAVNGCSPRRCRFIVEDAHTFAARAVRQGRSYGLVVLDPPTFGRSKRGWHSNAELLPLITAALSLVVTGGRLAFGVNSVGLDVTGLWNEVRRAGEGARCEPILEEVVHAGADFPLVPGHAHLQRFKMVFVRVERS